jgi:superfamily II DNA/RNA helicase
MFPLFPRSISSISSSRFICSLSSLTSSSSCLFVRFASYNSKSTRTRSLSDALRPPPSSSSHRTSSRDPSANRRPIRSVNENVAIESDPPAESEDAPVVSAPLNADLSVQNFPIIPSLARVLRDRFNISHFFPIQAESFDPIIQGKDLVARSKTGTGKTLAFALPLVQRIHSLRLRPQPSEALIVVVEPTRELAKQVETEFRKLDNSLAVVTIYGGVSAIQQMQNMRRGADVVIATPGRLVDLLERGAISLDNLKSLVVDEADEMLRMGFREQLEEILKFAPKTRQTLLFSATIPDWVVQVIRNYTQDPVLLDKVQGSEGETPTTITHKAIVTPDEFRDQVVLLGKLINQYKGRIIVFVNKKTDAFLISQGSLSSFIPTKCQALHGDVDQSGRERIMQSYRSGIFRVLVRIKCSFMCYCLHFLSMMNSFMRVK